jgi:hypothetical protein
MNKPELVEQMGEALFNLSDSLRSSGFLNQADHHARYENVVSAWQGLTAAIEALGVERLVAALERIRDLKPRPYDKHPADWSEQIDACEECQRYSGHPIQQGICNTHRRPLWDREAHDKHEKRALGSRAALIAREALSSLSKGRG